MHFTVVKSELSDQVKLLEVMEMMDKDTFEFKFGNELTYTTVLSDQRMVELIPNGSNTVVKYEDRKEFIRLVRKARLEESKEQVMPSSGGLSFLGRTRWYREVSSYPLSGQALKDRVWASLRTRHPHLFVDIVFPSVLPGTGLL